MVNVNDAIKKKLRRLKMHGAKYTKKNFISIKIISIKIISIFRGRFPEKLSITLS